MKYKKVGDKINVILLRDTKNNSFQNKSDIKLINTKVELISNNFYNIRDMHYVYEKIDYQVIGGLVIMNLYNNHLNYYEEEDKITKIDKYRNIYNKIKPKLIITNILKGSKVSEDNILKVPQILTKVNNIEVSTISNLREALKKNLVQNDKKYLSFLTEEKKFLVLDFDDIKKEELFLTEKYNYPLTEYTKKLLNI